MRSLILLLLSMFMINGATNAQHIASKDQKIVQQTIENMFTALSNSDTIAIKKYVTNDVNFYEYGQVWNLDTIMHKAMLGKSFPDFKRTNRFEFVRTTIHEKTAWVTYYLQSNITRDGKETSVNWMETVVLVHRNKQWKINTLHSSRLTNK